MEQFNKVISFVLGLVVVVIFLAVATGKINLKGKALPFSKGATPTTSAITPTPSSKKTTLSLNQVQPVKKNETASSTTPKGSYEYHSYGVTNTPSNIPSTGPELLLPLAFTSFIAGKYLNRKKN